MMSDDKLVSIVIVNYNSGHHLPRLLDSLSQQTWQDFEVIIIDNASSDGSSAYLEHRHEVRTVYNITNRGFAAGQNQGFALARGHFFLALNYDLVMTPTFLEELVGALEADPEAGWVCGKLLNMSADGALADTIYAVGHVLLPDRFPLLRGNGEVDRGQYERKEYVFGAPGAAALYRKEMVEDISFEGQFFDESFFTWCEDVDVDWRAQNRGWRCLYVPTAVAYHQGHVGEEHQEPFRSFRFKTGVRNRWLMVLANEKRADLGALLCYEVSLLLYAVREGLLGAYLAAFVSLLRLSPVAIRKRSKTFTDVEFA